VAATVHINEQWPEVTPELIRERTIQLSQRLADAQIPLTVYPGAEVMLSPTVENDWTVGRLLTLADQGREGDPPGTIRSSGRRGNAAAHFD
jgi:tyrosine-protein phosphatase YwqE